MRTAEPTSIDATNRLRLSVLRLARNIRTNTIGDVTPSQVAVLSTLVRHGDCSVGEIAEHEHVRPPSVSRIVAHLEERGLVDRHPDPADRRRVVIGLSSLGRSYVEEVRAAANTWLGDRLDRLGPGDLEAVIAALPALERLLAPDHAAHDVVPHAGAAHDGGEPLVESAAAGGSRT
ncbi:MarR family winged helix-turn-helix transcriptional regulator [Ilumatobacter sp.]|uniref:MarR family winged helix-turn-helix transcriptional regulator n=1 Tax=Ilumatobacter sp. TaxID=1967498 RepID=UPI003B5291EF